jgi:hypothetical protein
VDLRRTASPRKLAQVTTGGRVEVTKRTWRCVDELRVTVVDGGNHPVVLRKEPLTDA